MSRTHDSSKPEVATIDGHAVLASQMATHARALGVCEFLAIVLADPDGPPATPAAWQDAARTILGASGIDFDATYSATLAAGPLSHEEQQRARLVIESGKS